MTTEEQPPEEPRPETGEANPESAETGDDGKHFLYGMDIWERVETKARTYGERIKKRLGEPLLSREVLSLDDPIVRWLGIK